MDWIQFLSDNHIEFIERGPNTKRGEISCRCPFCGDDDPSQHLGISLEHERWGCLRNQTHRGKLPYKLISALLACSMAQARLVVAQYNRSDPDTLEAVVAAFEDPQPVSPIEQRWKGFPKEFKIYRSHGTTKKFYDYLLDRGFDDPDNLGHLYDLQCCNTGYWKDKLIIPVYHKEALVGWTGRHLANPRLAPRYLTSTADLKKGVWNYDDAIKGGDILFLTEGPIDAMKVDYYARNKGVRATCTFGTSFTIDQIAIIKQLMKKFKRTVALFDPEAIGETFLLTEWLPGVPIGHLPEGVEDPGALSEKQVYQLLDITDKL